LFIQGGFKGMYKNSISSGVLFLFLPQMHALLFVTIYPLCKLLPPNNGLQNTQTIA